MADLIGLNKVKPGQTATVVSIKGRSSINKRIADMGVIPGTAIKVNRVAPLGDPIEIIIRGYHLSLRKKEAANIIVELDVK
ncbi:MAG: ferrous iron transport protein A [Planctomycetes bacterium]|nr:ferrous iron transport protein A [Planctomycetota bacterium]